MSLTSDQIAEAFSSHRFPVAYPHLARDVRWNNVGGETIVSRDAVVAKCEETSRYLSTVTTVVAQIEAKRGADHVVVETLATYTEPSGDVSRVASCDVYQFAGDQIVAISSYNVEVPA